MQTHSDYDLVRRAIEKISLDWREQPQLESLATDLNVTANQLTKTFQRWCGLTPKAFLQAVTLDHARSFLAGGLPLLETSMELGLSGPGRLHDLFVTHEAMSPGDWKSRGAGIDIYHGFHDSQFGRALVMATQRGLCGMAFVIEGDEKLGSDAATFEDMKRRWPKANFTQDAAKTAPHAARAFEQQRWQKDDPLNVVLIGTDFEIRVWQQLTTIPLGTLTTYSDIADAIGKPKASRAVGAAIGRNPISFVVPCHRVIGKSGALTGYHWGLTRKRAMLGWEAGVVG